MVRQGAPQLLDPDAPASSGVIDYRADDALVDPQAFIPPELRARAPALTPPMVHTRPAKPRPARLVTTSPGAPTPVPTVKTAPSRQPRPLRLGNVTTQPGDADSIREHAAQADADALELPVTRTHVPDVYGVSSARASNPDALELPVTPASVPDATQPPLRRPADVSAEPPLSAHFADLPVERHIREVRAAVPDEPDIASVRTSAGNAQHINQRRTSVPVAPQQTVLRPTIMAAPLNIEQVTPDRWAPLPDSYEDEPRAPASERQHRERLKREQEGRTWSE
jgi:hypothetical protein